MADHMRKQIRDAALAVLTGLETTAGNVHATRRHPLQREELPALCVYAINEDSSVDGMGAARPLRRDLTLVVQAVAEDNQELDDILDQMALEVEVAIAADPTLGGLAYDAVLTRTEISIERAGARQAAVDTGSASLSFRVTYRTRKTDPTLNAI